MIGYTMSEASQIEYEKIDEVEFAKLDVVFNMKVKTVPINKSEEFVLEQDAFGRWKIYGWTINTNVHNHSKSAGKNIRKSVSAHCRIRCHAIHPFFRMDFCNACVILT